MMVRHRVVSRFNDPSRTLFGYLLDAGGTWVVCPKCSGPASVKVEVDEKDCFGETAELTCTSCLHRSTSLPPPTPPPPYCYGCGTRISIFRPLPKQRGMGLGPPNRRQGCGVCRRLKHGSDPYFGLPFFLKTEIGGKEFWAVNRRHLSDLRMYLGATLRERNPWIGISLTAMARLPAWTKVASMRPKIVRTIDKMLASAERHRLT